MDLEINHNVYILGAGFSRDAGLPLIKDFLVHMRDSHEWLIAAQRIEEAEAVQKVLEFRLKSASAAYWVNLDLENIEELFSLASATAGEMDRYTRLAIAATLDFSRQTKKPRIGDMHINGSGQSKLFVPGDVDGNGRKHPIWARMAQTAVYQPGSSYLGPFKIDFYTFYLARLLGMFLDGKPQGQNTFITFNYDTILEEALSDLKVPFHCELSHAEILKDHPRIPILKLHGSVSWGQNELPDSGKSSFRIFDSYQELMENRCMPALIPPTWKKFLGGYLERIWDSAVKRLNTATRIVIIGFSIPPTDMHFKYLMAAGLQNNVSLRQILFVNPYQETQKDDFKTRVRQLFRESYVDSSLIDFDFVDLRGFTQVDGTMGRKFHSINRPSEYGLSITI